MAAITEPITTLNTLADITVERCIIAAVVIITPYRAIAAATSTTIIAHIATMGTIIAASGAADGTPTALARAGVGRTTPTASSGFATNFQATIFKMETAASGAAVFFVLDGQCGLSGLVAFVGFAINYPSSIDSSA